MSARTRSAGATLALVAACALALRAAHAQEPTRDSTHADAPAPGPMLGSTTDSTRVIRGIEIERHGVFEPGEAQNWLIRAGNALHATTRRHIVERELLVRPGEPLDSARLAETARNLRALGIFRRVLIDSVRTDSGLVLRVVTKDGWSTHPKFDFSTAGGQTAYSIGVEEVNLFGNAAYGAIAFADNPDRSTVTALFRQPRLFASRIYLQAGIQARSDGRSLSFGLGQPFLSYS
ncbi:MAG TPA: hypothetical protein VFS33_08255, partial [Gemmatimonadales bacterium]|nr:hypothetical protein [Gemmatimonadales bacterium]